MGTTEEQQQRAKILIEQADRLLGKLAVDVSDVPIRDVTLVVCVTQNAH